MQGISTRDMPREQWLELRRGGIGGSDAAAIVGLNPYSSPWSVWADKLGKTPGAEDSEAMRQGRDLEAYVVARFEEATGLRARRRNKLIRNPKYPWALANIDREIVGAAAGLECKTTSVLNLRKFRDGDYPAQYYVQCVHYLAVTGWDRWYLGVLILNNGFRVYTVDRDEAEIEALMGAEERFWRDHVLTGTPPTVDGMPATRKTLDRLPADDDAVDLSHYEHHIDRLETLNRQIKALNEEKTRCENQVKAALGGAVTGYGMRYAVTWRPQERCAFDYRRFAADHPGLDLTSYITTSTSRPLHIKEVR